MEYFCLPIAEMDYCDLSPTPPAFRHFDLMAGEEGCGFVGERFRKSQAAPTPCSKYSRGVMPNSLLKHAEK